MLADSGQRADYCLGLEAASTSPLKTAPPVFLESGLTLRRRPGTFRLLGEHRDSGVAGGRSLARGTELSIAIDRYGRRCWDSRWAGCVGVRAIILFRGRNRPVAVVARRAVLSM